MLRDGDEVKRTRCSYLMPISTAIAECRYCIQSVGCRALTWHAQAQFNRVACGSLLLILNRARGGRMNCDVKRVNDA
jgi:hypothetical protein